MKSYNVEPNIFYQLDRKDRKVYYIDYRVKGVRRRERVGYLLQAARDALQSRLTDIRRERFDGILPEPSCTIKEFWDRYLIHSKATKSPLQTEREKGIYKKHLIPNFGRIPLNEITVDQVEGFQARRKDDGRAASTINKEVQLLKNMAKKAVEWGKIRNYPFASVKPFREPVGRVRWLEGDQYPKLVDHLPSWLKPIAIIAAFTGMRRGEVCGLKKENIDKRKRQIILEETKNHERRVIPMNQTVYDIITSLPPRIDAPYLFAGQNGQPISRANVSVAFKRACKKAGIKNFRFHDLRHHFASRLTMAGTSQRGIMELLGHKDPKMTIRYQHLSPDYLRGAVESLDEKTAKANG